MYDENKAKRVINFISSLKHTKGKWHGKLFDLLPWQQDIIKNVFGTVKRNGYRQYNTAGNVNKSAVEIYPKFLKLL